MYELTEADKIKYKESGYIILRNAIDLSPINEMMEFVAHVIKLETADMAELSNLTNDQILNQLLIQLKTENPSSSSWIYNTILTSFALREFFVKIKIDHLAMGLLDIKDKRNLGSVSPAFRFDIPGDTKNIRTWHQDSNYFLENEKGCEHLVVWIPMNRAIKDNGSVIVAPGSHKNGRLVCEHEKHDGFSSEQYTSPEELYKNYDFEYIEADKGDVAFIDMDLFHSSGKNVTKDQVRYTAQIRFNTINKPSYRPVFLRPEYPSYTRRRINSEKC